jgi:hypothetical protein
MNINKKFDRLRQWTGEKMGGEAKTTTSDEFKRLEMEMNMRQDGMLSICPLFQNIILILTLGLRKISDSMNQYVQHEGKRTQTDDLYIDNLGTSMLEHGQDFAPDSEFGSCLKGMCLRRCYTGDLT